LSDFEIVSKPYADPESKVVALFKPYIFYFGRIFIWDVVWKKILLYSEPLALLENFG
jgi:hypothetical protein